jgi:ADP-heptose:LPS heptosyltransferase
VAESADAIDASGRYSLRQLAEVLHDSVGVISVNTGIAHFAAAVGARTLTLEGPTSALRWGPLGTRVTSVESSHPGCGYLNLGWEYAGRRQDCMNGISVDDVEAAFEALIEGRDVATAGPSPSGQGLGA